MKGEVGREEGGGRRRSACKREEVGGLEEKKVENETHVHSSLIRLDSDGHLVRERRKVLVRELRLTSEGLTTLSGL